MLFPILFVSLVILVSASNPSHHLRRKRHTAYAACKPFILPYNAEWIRRWYGRRCKGLFVCCEGYEMVVKTVCNKRGRWKVKTLCVPTISPRTTTPSSTTTQSITSSSTTTQSTTMSRSTTQGTTAPSSTPSSMTTSSTTTIQQSVQCDADSMVENGVITSDEISIEVGSVVQFNCSSGFTLNGRVGILTCNSEGFFDPDIICEDCRSQDREFFVGRHMVVSSVAESAADCNEQCDADPDCFTADFDIDTCFFNFLIEEVETGNIDVCRQACYNNSLCNAFIVSTVDALNPDCRLFTKPFDTFAPDEKISSTCV